ncbi:MAG: Succinate-semialdehyde dehydrogenase [Bacteroidota bacterium]|jgi:succinate-semialdehyde dehydrogenase/glutarate-semialdehyde dehydrogenase
MKQLVSNTKWLKSQAFINGSWVHADSGKTMEVTNPFDNSLITNVPDMGQPETQRAIEAAHQAFQSWKKTTAGERARLLKQLFSLLMEHQTELAYLLTLEQGKPLAEAKGEIGYGASYIEWFAEEARRNYGDTILGQEADKRILVIKQPIGVVGIITPWNFPNAMLTRKMAAALAAGCTIVIKPAEATPLSALALAALAEQAGFPKGVINIVTTSTPVVIGKELTSNPLVRKISFTGSTPVGKWLMQQSGQTLKKLSLELGGNAPFIVFDDADLDAAVAGAMISKYRNAGQTCVCANRIYVQSAVYQPFIEKLTQAVKALKVGNGLENGTVIGPLIDQKAFEKVDRLVKDAISKGAKLLTGGKKHAFGGTFYEPTILTDANKEMALTQEEIFGPVAPIYRFETENEVIQKANDTPFGLAAYFYGQNMNRIWRVAEALEYGIVGINTGLISTAVAPFGGIKESGFGREGSKYGMDDYLEMKYMCFGGV